MMGYERTEYPRPQMRRDDWLPLNGTWEFEFDDADTGRERRLETGTTPLAGHIVVPFCYQWEASGIGDERDHPVVWYRRTFRTEGRGTRRALLCFNGCDYETDVWINGAHVAFHRGAYTPFSADVTPYLREENVLVVRCRDLPDEGQPRGKQTWKGEPFLCWYTPSTGIWQSVWMEYFGEDAAESVSVLADYDACSFGGELTLVRGIADEAEFTVRFEGKTLLRARIPLCEKRTPYSFSLGGDAAALAWSLEQPRLLFVDVAIFCGGVQSDAVHLRFGMRKISFNGEGDFCLNGKPVYQRLVLDQGYWRESGLTPPSAEALKRDILAAKSMGFNGARKHQKIEDPYFEYYAEELGFLTWCEMPACYRFDGESAAALMREWTSIVLSAKSKTSVVCYVPVNESWGVPNVCSDAAQQNFARSLYYLTCALDPTRPVNTNDGWECLDKTDIVGIHDYAGCGDGFAEKYRRESLDDVVPQGRRLMAHGCLYGGQPVFMTEFGGIAMRAEAEGENWGYGDGAQSVSEFYRLFRSLLEALHDCGFSGYCYTQLTDVRQEVNGLLREDRTPKFDFEVLRKLNEAYGRKRETERPA